MKPGKASKTRRNVCETVKINADAKKRTKIGRNYQIKTKFLKNAKNCVIARIEVKLVETRFIGNFSIFCSSTNIIAVILVELYQYYRDNIGNFFSPGIELEPAQAHLRST